MVWPSSLQNLLISRSSYIAIFKSLKTEKRTCLIDNLIINKLFSSSPKIQSENTYGYMLRNVWYEILFEDSLLNLIARVQKVRELQYIHIGSFFKLAFQCIKWKIKKKNFFFTLQLVCKKKNSSLCGTYSMRKMFYCIKF